MMAGDPVLLRQLAEGFRALAKSAEQMSERIRLNSIAKDCDQRAAALEASQGDEGETRRDMRPKKGAKGKSKNPSGDKKD